MDDLLTNLLVYQIIIDLFKITIGSGLCFGALKWRRGLLTTTAIVWGCLIGAGIGIGCVYADLVEIEGIIIMTLIGAIVFPVLTYTIAGINRFVLGFLVGSKLLFMLTTVLAKGGDMEITTALTLPLLLGTIIGVFLMAWTRMRVSAFLLSCTFVGASEIAPVISEWINRIMYGITGNYSYLIDPIDLLFALFKIELTDVWTLISMIVLMAFGCYAQFQRLKAKGLSADMPIIGFEVPREKNGTIYKH